MTNFSLFLELTLQFFPQTLSMFIHTFFLWTSPDGAVFMAQGTGFWYPNQGFMFLIIVTLMLFSLWLTMKSLFSLFSRWAFRMNSSCLQILIFWNVKHPFHYLSCLLKFINKIHSQIWIFFKCLQNLIFCLLKLSSFNHKAWVFYSWESTLKPQSLNLLWELGLFASEI